MKDFLSKYDTVIFDMDGVITSEDNYWSSAALTVYEYLESEKYFGDKKIDAAAVSKQTKEIRKEIFADDRIITVLKGHGVNSNWDLGFVVVLISFILNSRDSEKILEFAKGLSENILDEYDRLSELAAKAKGLDFSYTKRNGKLWLGMHYCFQEWFLGEDGFYSQYGRAAIESGKPGLVNSEEPIISHDSLNTLLKELSKEKRVCTGTGRPGIEIITPLTAWGVKDYFAKDGLCNYDHVAAAEKKLNATLTKPHPYMFLKALYGTDYDDEKLVNGNYDISKINRTLVVGDAGADILAAQAMGADFCAVLTGVSGKDARGYFEKLNADYILDSAAELI